MTIVVVNTGLAAALSLYLGDDTYRMHLYASAITPSQTDTLGLYSAAEASFTGYTAQDITGWTTPAVSGSAVYSTASPLTFIQTADEVTSLYGYYVTDSSDTVLQWVELFSDAPIVLAVSGDNVKITPYLEDGDE